MSTLIINNFTKMNFNLTYFILFIILFLIEIGIAYFLHTGFIRHTFGDFLVVIMLYCFLKSFIDFTPVKTAIYVLLIAYTIEILQLTPFLKWLNLQNNTLANTVLGHTFHTNDLWAYTIGMLTVIFIEFMFNNSNSQPSQ